MSISTYAPTGNSKSGTSSTGKTPLASAKWKVIGTFVATYAELLERLPDAAAKSEAELRISEAVRTVDGTFTDAERTELLTQVKNELLGFGPIEPLLQDSTVSEIMVNSADRV